LINTSLSRQKSHFRVCIKNPFICIHHPFLSMLTLLLHYR
jgi:hypothetical protein